MQAVIPRATYRLQLHQGFDFEAARAVLPYLHRLGISHLYCSPITRARSGSLHGYDVVDHAHISPELGGRTGFERFATDAKALGMGLLLDQVPNHMGVFGADNAWWMDVLENGAASEYAAYFDIDWRPPNPALHRKLLVPVLGDSYGHVLDSGDIRLVCDAATGVLALQYHEHRFPLDPGTYPGVLRGAGLQRGDGTEARRMLEDLADAFAAVPSRDADAPQALARRAFVRELQARLAQSVAADSSVAAALAAYVAALNDPAARDQLDLLHEAQAYRLSHWRLAADEINYRRFFDVNALAALRVEDERVFDAVQGMALDLAASGMVDGLRIDHPDGLLDPAAYFANIQQAFMRRLGTAATQADRAQTPAPLYVLAEKIVASHEEVPPTWALSGTTGYEFAVLVNGLLVERRNAKSMERTWRMFIGATDSTSDYAEIVQVCKRLVARGALASQLTVLAHALQRIALADRRTRDYGFNSLRDAIAEVAAAMPVYRTYVVHQASAQDRRFIDWAISQAAKRGDAGDAGLFDFLRSCLLMQATATASADTVEAVRQFALGFQQFCAPVAAKGVEDTAFYRYYRLASLNDVGGDPGTFGVSASAFHRANATRAAQWPHTMLATSTHDNKRAEDVRCRIDVLSEMPGAWRLAQRRWKVATRAWRSEVAGAVAPSMADQFLLHQTLLGTLPANGLAPDEIAGYRERIGQYMLKAAREAKVRTSWSQPDAAYEAALQAFVLGLLGRVDGNPVLAELQSRASAIAWFGALNSLAMTVLKLTCPGVPDLYQGTELMDFSLVDPDNRRPVDYALRERLLSELERMRTSDDVANQVRKIASEPADGRIKLWLISQLLGLRRTREELFHAGRYEALKVQGPRRRHVVAYARRSGKAALLVVVARKFAALENQSGQLPVGPDIWGGTQVQLPAWLLPSYHAKDAFTQTGCDLGRTTVDLGDLFHSLPFAAIFTQL
jgi:(1->4)-alpha-D-glucan 1-alpha-D-glucosylmutase